MGIKVLIIVVAVVLLFELVEHVVLPIAAVFGSKRRRPATGAEGMAGRVGRVVRWSGPGGSVVVDGEIWRATSREPLAAGDEIEVRGVRGLTLEVTPRRSDAMP